MTIAFWYDTISLVLETYGEVSEWFKELVLKTSDAKAPRVRISASPFFLIFILGNDYETVVVALVRRSTQEAEEAPLLRV